MGWGSGNLGGGSGGLNFKIVGGMSEPTSAKENTIWVNTDQNITSYILSATEPETPEDGMVLITIGTDSAVAFSVTKKNPVMVYPISAKQYISGAWVDKTAKSYHGGGWVDWGIYLINGSELNTEYAGAWNQTTGNQGVGGSAQMTSEGLLITATQPTIGKGSALRYGPDEKINFSGITSIRIVASIKSGSGKLFVGITPVFDTSYDSESVAYISAVITQANQTFSLPVPEVDGEYYLRVGTNTLANGEAYSYIINSLQLVRGGTNENNLY